MTRTEDREAVQGERDKIIAEFEKQTLQWAARPVVVEEAKTINEKRNKLADQLFTNYWKLDKFVRTRTYYDRIGAVSSDGVVDFGAFVVTEKRN